MNVNSAYAAGFLRKCGERGATADQAVQLLKASVSVPPVPMFGAARYTDRLLALIGRRTANLRNLTNQLSEIPPAQQVLSNPEFARLARGGHRMTTNGLNAATAITRDGNALSRMLKQPNRFNGQVLGLHRAKDGYLDVLRDSPNEVAALNEHILRR